MIEPVASTDYDVDISELLGRYLKPELMITPDGVFPTIAGIPEFLEAVHHIVNNKLEE